MLQVSSLGQLRDSAAVGQPGNSVREDQVRGQPGAELQLAGNLRNFRLEAEKSSGQSFRRRHLFHRAR